MTASTTVHNPAVYNVRIRNGRDGACAAAAILRDTPVPTVIIPGNHDPLLEGCVWRRDDFNNEVRDISNVILALDSDPTEVAGAFIIPCPVRSKSEPVDLLNSIPVGERGEQFRIGIAHGFWQTYNGQTVYENSVGNV